MVMVRGEVLLGGVNLGFGVGVGWYDGVFLFVRRVCLLKRWIGWWVILGLCILGCFCGFKWINCKGMIVVVWLKLVRFCLY